MNSKVAIEKVCGDAEGRACDMLLVALGYETRATHVASKLAHPPKAKYALAFKERQLFSYKKNEAWFRSRGFAIEPFDELTVREWWQRTVQVVAANKDTDLPLKIVIDISSMSRVVMAEILMGLYEQERDFAVEVLFAYSPAKYRPPPATPPLITVSGPVVPELAGWSDPDLPPVALIGLGYEYDRALGTLENLEPTSAWIFMPTGEDSRYERSMEKANSDLMSILPSDHVLSYRVDRAFDLFANLESMVYGLLESARPIIVTLGPKIFALVAMLVALVHYNRVSVWRVSGGQAEPPLDRSAQGKTIWIGALLFPNTKL